MKMEQCSETSAYKTQMPRNYTRGKHKTFRTWRKFELEILKFWDGQGEGTAGRNVTTRLSECLCGKRNDFLYSTINVGKQYFLQVDLPPLITALAKEPLAWKIQHAAYIIDTVTLDDAKLALLNQHERQFLKHKPP